MKVVLRTDVEQLGKKGDLLEVAPGYARNYLVPRGLAMVASKGAEKQAGAMRRTRDARDTHRPPPSCWRVVSRRSSASVRAVARRGHTGGRDSWARDVHSPVDERPPLSPGNSHRFPGLSTSNPQGRGVTMRWGA